MTSGATTHSGRVADASSLDREHTERQRAARATVLAGLLAGAAMLAWVAAAAALDGVGPSHPLVVGAAIFGEDVGGPLAVVAGALLWASVSVALAVPYAWIVPRDFPFVSASGIGVGYSFFVMALMTSLVLPWVNPVMRAAMSERGGAWVVAYLVFGVILGFVPALRRRRGR